MFQLSPPRSASTAPGDSDVSIASSSDHAGIAIARQMELLGDALAWIRLELEAERLAGAPGASDRDRRLHARGQIDLALAMARELSDSPYLRPKR